MKDQILKLREEGKSYREIQEILGCSKGTVAYHCGEGQKEKNSDRMRKRRKDTVISRRIENFQYDRKLKDKSEDFQRERSKKKLGKRTMTFSWQDVTERFGWETICYLTGRAINLREPRTYQFDHKVPYAKGGTSDIDNLGIVCRDANLAKSDMTIDEFLQLCKEVLEFNGYEIRKRTEVV